MRRRTARQSAIQIVAPYASMPPAGDLKVPLRSSSLQTVSKGWNREKPERSSRRTTGVRPCGSQAKAPARTIGRTRSCVTQHERQERGLPP